MAAHETFEIIYSPATGDVIVYRMVKAGVCGPFSPRAEAADLVGAQAEALRHGFSRSGAWREMGDGSMVAPAVRLHDLTANSSATSNTTVSADSGVSNDFWADAKLIHSYTRAEAIADGVLIDVSMTAREAGFRWPVALTAAAWAEAVAWDEDNRAVQDEAGRLWDVLTMARLAAKRGGTGARTFDVLRVPNTRGALTPRKLTLRLVAGPGTGGEPVITITCTTED